MASPAKVWSHWPKGRFEEIYPQTQHQRCWVHKIANVLNYLPKAVQPKAKQALAQIWVTETKADASIAYEVPVDCQGWCMQRRSSGDSAALVTA